MLSGLQLMVRCFLICSDQKICCRWKYFWKNTPYVLAWEKSSIRISKASWWLNLTKPSYGYYGNFCTIFIGNVLFEFLFIVKLMTVGLFRKLLCNETFSKILHNREALCTENYVERFKFLMWLEEYEVEKELAMYNKIGVKVKYEKDRQLVRLNVCMSSFLIFNLLSIWKRFLRAMMLNDFD